MQQDSDVFFVIPGDINQLTGGYGYDRELRRHLEQQGHRVTLVTLASDFPAPSQQSLDDAFQQLSALPDQALVIIDGLAYGVMDAIAESLCTRLRLIALCHHPLALETGLSDVTAASLFVSEKRALNCAQAIIVTSRNTQAILMNQFDIAPEKITLAEPGTEPREFSEGGNTPPRLLTLATLTRRKGHDVLITALAQLQDLPWEAHFIGGGEFDPAWTSHLHHLVAEHQLTSRIHFRGALRDTAADYRQSDLFVLPSWFEGYGMVFAEATAFGLPIVAARAGAVPDLVGDDNGRLITPGDSDELAATLRQLLTNTALRHQLRVGAQQRAQHLPRWSQSAAMVSELLTTVRTL